MRKLKRLIRQRSRPQFKTEGSNVVIERGCRFPAAHNIDLGSDLYFGFECLIFGFGGVKVGSGTIFGHRVEILTRNHNFDSSDLRSLPYDDRYILSEVQIGENCWIGAGVKVLPGVTIGEGSVIGMGAVVAKDVPPLSVVVGNPGRVVKSLDAIRYDKLKSSGQIYMRMKREGRFE